MIITTEVNIFKKGGKSEKINISDLSLNSHKLISVKCDICFAEKDIKYQDYNKITSNQTEMYYCSKCKNLKANQTKRRLYGPDLKQIVDKQKLTTIDKYGVDNVSKLDHIKNAKKNTCYKNYKVDVPSKSEFIKDKMKQTCMVRYGFEYPLQSNEIREKIKNTNLNKYGVENVFQSDGIKNLIKGSLISKYGVDHPMKSPSIFEKQMKSSFRIKEFNGIIYQGTYELDFILFCMSNGIEFERGPVIEYEDGTYHSDFYIKKINLIAEIKSSYTYNKELSKNSKKQKACIDRGYNFIFIIDKNYTQFSELILV